MAEGVDPRMSRMNILPEVFVDAEEARRQMTPLIKGYLSLGASFGKGVFIDKPFNTYDVFVTLQTKDINAAYQKHFFGREDALDGMDVDIREGAIKTFGKLVLTPVTVPIKLVRTFFEFMLREDAADAEFVEDADKETDAEAE